MKIPVLKTKDLLSVTDLNREEILGLFELTSNLKKNTRRGRETNLLLKKSLAMIFEKSSTRTRVSFEVGLTQLGGHALFLSDDIQLHRGESIKDTAMVLSRYVNGIMIRTFEHLKVAELARHATIPVINGLSDSHHPCQALADFFTIYEIHRDPASVGLAYIGDGNNVANSLILCAAILGTSIAVASPAGYRPDEDIVSAARAIAAGTGARILITSNIEEAAADADYVYTDVWVSMGEERKAARKRKALSPYKIDSRLLSKCKPGCRIMHCLPAHRGEEIASDVLDSKNSVVFEQAENRLHVQKAIMCALMLK